MNILKEKREKLADLRNELVGLTAADTLTDEQIQRVSTINSEVEKLSGEIETLEVAQRNAARKAAPVVHSTSNSEEKEIQRISDSLSSCAAPVTAR